MHMVARTEKSRSVSYAERKRTYLRHLRFWNDFLTRHEINLFLSAWMPHEVPDHIVHFLCRARGIPTLMFVVTPILNCEYLVRDWERSSVRLRERYDLLLKEYANADITDIPLSPAFDEYYEKQSNPQGLGAYTWPPDPTPLQRFIKRLRTNPVVSMLTAVRYASTLLSAHMWYRRLQKCYAARSRGKHHSRHNPKKRCRQGTLPRRHQSKLKGGAQWPRAYNSFTNTRTGTASAAAPFV